MKNDIEIKYDFKILDFVKNNDYTYYFYKIIVDNKMNYKIIRIDNKSYDKDFIEDIMLDINTDIEDIINIENKLYIKMVLLSN